MTGKEQRDKEREITQMDSRRNREAGINQPLKMGECDKCLVSAKAAVMRERVVPADPHKVEHAVF